MYLKLQYVRLEVHSKHSQKQSDKLQKIYAITKAIFLYYINNILIAIKINKAAKYIMLITIIILYIAMTIIYIAIL